MFEDFNTLVRQRQSVRRFAPRPVEKEKLLQCIEAARLAPSANNSQPWYFIVVDDTELKNEVARTTFGPANTFNKFNLEAPVIIVMVIEATDMLTKMASKFKKKDWSQIDTGIAAAHFCLQATELGLGTCLIGWFDEGKVKDLLNIQEDRKIGLLISIGYAPDYYRIREKTRKSVSEISGFNSYKGK